MISVSLSHTFSVTNSGIMDLDVLSQIILQNSSLQSTSPWLKLTLEELWEEVSVFLDVCKSHDLIPPPPTLMFFLTHNSITQSQASAAQTTDLKEKIAPSRTTNPTKRNRLMDMSLAMHLFDDLCCLCV